MYKYYVSIVLSRTDSEMKFEGEKIAKWEWFHHKVWFFSAENNDILCMLEN